MWKGSEALRLNEYFSNKEKLNELKVLKRYASKKGDPKLENNYKKEIDNIENNIKEFISSLDNKHLKSIIYMSLDIDDMEE